MKSRLVAALAIVIILTGCARTSKPEWLRLLDRARNFAKAGKADSAQVYVGRASNTLLKEYGRSDTTVVIQFYDSGAPMYYHVRSYDDVELLFKSIVEIEKSICGVEDPRLPAAVFALAEVCNQRGEFGRADSLYQSALEMAPHAYAAGDPALGKFYRGLADAKTNLAKYAAADSLYGICSSLAKGGGAQGNAERALCENNWGFLKWKRNDEKAGDMESAAELLENALAQREKLYGLSHPEVAVTLGNLAKVHYANRQRVEADSCFSRAIRILESSLGRNNAEMAKLYNNMGALRKNQGRAIEAKEYYTWSLDIKKRISGTDNESYATGLNNIGLLCAENAEYAEAELKYEEALSIRRRIWLKNPSKLAESEEALALLYRSQKKYDQALPLYLSALETYKALHGENHPKVVQAMLNIGAIYEDQGDNEKAEALFTRVLEIESARAKPNDALLADVHGNLGTIASAKDNLPAALKHWKSAEEMRLKQYGPRHPKYAESLTDIALYHKKSRDYGEAARYYAQALQIRRRMLGPNHPRTAETMQSLSELYRLQGKRDEALSLAEESYLSRREHFTDNAIAMSEKDAMDDSRAMSKSLDLYLSCCFRASPNDTARKVKAAEIIFAGKGLILDELLERKRTISSDADSVAVSLSRDLLDAKRSRERYFLQENEIVPSAFGDKMNMMSAEIDSLDKELALRSARYRINKQSSHFGLNDLFQALPDNAVLIEYLKYNDYPASSDEPVSRYCAAVLSKTGGVWVVALARAAVIDSMISEYRGHMHSIAAQKHMPTAEQQTEYARIARSLTKHLIDPIKGQAPIGSLLLFAADGDINFVSFAGLMIGEDRYLIEDYSVHYLATGRDVLRNQDRATTKTGLLALGDPEIARKQRGLKSFFSRGAASRDPGRLPGAQVEIKSVVNQWKRSTDEKADYFLGEDATERTFREKAPSYRVIHVAAHGYFSESPEDRISNGSKEEDEVKSIPMDLMITSGLILAQGGKRRAAAPSVDDGILMASEIASMDLEGSDLMVLSGCETALGKVVHGEGVYGFRRSFQLAGVRSLVTAQWSISDRLSAEVMSEIYAFDKGPLYERMRNMQIGMIEHLRSSGSNDHPYSWAAFIAQGDWR